MRIDSPGQPAQAPRAVATKFLLIGLSIQLALMLGSDMMAELLRLRFVPHILLCGMGGAVGITLGVLLPRILARRATS